MTLHFICIYSSNLVEKRANWSQINLEGNLTVTSALHAVLEQPKTVLCIK